MTLEQLTQDIDKLALMSDVELTEHCKPYFSVTRPSSIPKPISNKLLAKMGKGTSKEKREKLAGLQALMASRGIDLGKLMK